MQFSFAVTMQLIDCQERIWDTVKEVTLLEWTRS